MKVDLTVNGTNITADVEDRMLLVHFLRDVANLTATNVGCDTTSCGACTVLLDGESVKSCTVLAAQASGHEVTTLEGLATNGEMHPVQRAFHTEGELATVRTYLGVGILHAGAPPELARCVAGRLVAAYPLAKLEDPTFGANDESVKTRVQHMAAACR